MKKNNLGKLYDLLTPEERFRLVIAAKTRGDEGELRKATLRERGDIGTIWAI